jgi:hypothetical protein
VCLAAVRLPAAFEPASIAAGATEVGWDEASSTPYDQALTLQDCLRTFAYDLEVPPPNANDALTAFLYVVADPRPSHAPAGLTVVSADRCRFAYPLAEPGDTLPWVRSLYLPGLDPRRLGAAHRVTRRWTGSSIGIPLMRPVATENR